MKFYAFHLILFEFFGILWNPREFNGILSFPLISIHFCLASLDFHAFFLKYSSNDFFWILLHALDFCGILIWISLELYSFHWFLRISIESSGFEVHWSSIVSIAFYEFVLNSLDFYGILWNSMEFYRFHWFLWCFFCFSGFPCNFFKYSSTDFCWVLLNALDSCGILIWVSLELYSFHWFQRISFEFFAFVWNSICSIDFYGFLCCLLTSREFNRHP